MCVTCQLAPGEGGAAGKVAYIDTEGTFRPERIAAIAQRFGFEPEGVLNNVRALCAVGPACRIAGPVSRAAALTPAHQGSPLHVHTR